MNSVIDAHNSTAVVDIASRVDAYDWPSNSADLDAHGWALVPSLLTGTECAAIATLYADNSRFRSHVVMARHGFGRGEYKYFAHPLPEIISELRTALYRRLVPIANRWNEAMGIAVRYPAAHADFITRCHNAGQTRPTPLLLQYGEGDFNALHTEQRPRMQSRVEVVPLGHGDGVVWAVRNRPVQGTRGIYRVNMRHGVSRLRSGHRHTLGVIFHDAK
jgi:hypothetical protein